MIYGKSTVWEDTDDCAKRNHLTISLINVLSDIFGIILDCAIWSPSHGNNVVDSMNERYKKL